MSDAAESRGVAAGGGANTGAGAGAGAGAGSTAAASGDPTTPLHGEAAQGPGETPPRRRGRMSVTEAAAAAVAAAAVLACPVLHVTLGATLPPHESGTLTFKQDLARVQQMLHDHGLDDHTEPSVLRCPADFRCTSTLFPSDWLAYLQRFQAHCLHDSSWKPTEWGSAEALVDNAGLGELTEQDTYPLDDPVVDAMLETKEGGQAHLLSHASEGYFVPVHMPSGPVFDSKGTVPGGWVGSSHSLLQELIELSPSLGIELRPLAGKVRRGGGFDVSDATINAINNESVSLLKFHAGTGQAPGDKAAGASPGPPGPPAPPPPPFAIERQVWLALYEACRLSIKLGTVIVLKPA